MIALGEGRDVRGGRRGRQFGRDDASGTPSPSGGTRPDDLALFGAGADRRAGSALIGLPWRLQPPPCQDVARAVHFVALSERSRAEE